MFLVENYTSIIQLLKLTPTFTRNLTPLNSVAVKVIWVLNPPVSSNVTTCHTSENRTLPDLTLPNLIPNKLSGGLLYGARAVVPNLF